MLKRWVARNFRNPAGLLGRLVGKLMLKGNSRAVVWTVGLMDIAVDDHVLEIGYGPGFGIERAALVANKGQIKGLDISATMRAAASKRNRRVIEAGQVELRTGDVHTMPYAGHIFDRAFSVHCIYFWQRPLAALQEIRRVLRPGGALGITILSRTRWQQVKTVPPPDLFTLYEPSEVVALMQAAGFKNVQAKDAAQADGLRCACIVGTR